MLIGPRGIRLSKNGGEEFAAVTDAVAAKAPVSSAEVLGKTVYAYGAHRLIVSTDGGASWKGVKTPAKRSIHDVSFGRVGKGFLLDTRGEIWRTTNGGRSWSEIECLGDWRPNAIDFADAMHGFALVTPARATYSGAYLLRTNDAGTSWHPQFLSGGPATALEGSGSTSFLLVGDSVLYATTTGGDLKAASRLTLKAKPRSLTKRGTVRLDGRLSPAHGGEDVLVSRYMAGRWTAKHATVASNGTFSTRWAVTRTATFVAQVFADADRGAAATPALSVKIVPRKR
jgi:photosystem II stability/assembly factor-like uncharacterized protein